ncbi:MAG TPA: hypothetical protein VF590_17390 [Isosphaeraceae bacterium]
MARSPLASVREALLEVTLGLAEGLRHAGLRLPDVPAPGDAAAMLAALDDFARRTAPDRSAPPDRRARAIALLGQQRFAEAKGELTARLDPHEPHPVQLAAVRAPGGYPEPEVATLLLGPWRGYSPALHGEVLQILLGRSAWIGPVLDAVAARIVPAGLIPPARRALLLRDRDPAVRARARRLLAAEIPGPRREAIARYRAALAPPADPRRGEAVFARECPGCHRLGEAGHTVGPNLASVQRRTPEEVLVHVLDPNREVAPDFLEYTVALRDGRVLSGLVATETATSVTLLRPQGLEETVPRPDIDAITSTGRSLMPEGLEAHITPQEMADLLASLFELQR